MRMNECKQDRVGVCVCMCDGYFEFVSVCDGYLFELDIFLLYINSL